MKYREITPADDPAIAEIVRMNLKAHDLDLPGTVYFDDNLNHLSEFYCEEGKRRFYYIVTDDEDRVIGGVGLAEFLYFENCAELQKLYLTDAAKGSGMGYEMVRLVERKAKELGYDRRRTQISLRRYTYMKSWGIGRSKSPRESSMRR